MEEFTQPGDPLKIDYAYRSNGTRGFIEAISLWRDPAQAKVLAYTAECIRARVQSKTEFTAVVEMEPARENPRHQFVARLFEGTHWAGKSGAQGVWVQALHRIPGHELTPDPIYMGGVNSRCTLVPFELAAAKPGAEDKRAARATSSLFNNH